MRLLSRLLIIFVLCFVAIVLPTMPAQAQDTYITLSPDDGVPGTLVTVRGYNFTAREWVDVFYYADSSRTHVIEIETNQEGYFRVDFEIPESYTGPHKVLAEDQEEVEAYDSFTVRPGLTIDPEEGPVGTNVTVEGHGFAEEEVDIELMYYLDDTVEVVADDIEADEDGWWEQDFVIPPSDKGSHKIDALGRETSSTKVEDAYFEIKPGIIMLDESSGELVKELSGSPGDSITMRGSGFAASERDITILFDGEAVLTEIRADPTGYWEEDFDVPERPKGEYSVTAEGERTDHEDVGELDFEIEPGLRLFPDAGHVGTNLTATGGGFEANKNVDIEYNGAEVEELTGTPRTDANGSFEVSFEVLESKHGDRVVLAEDAAGSNATAVFTMESVSPDMPYLISPSDGERIGFIGKVRLTFNWSEVEDLSGVRYNLQIATSANFTTTGGFADPIRAIPRIVGANYTLDETEALPYGTYYWIVQAVDGADNKSGWTEPRSFRVGVMPLWAFIIIVVVAAGGIGTAVYFLFIRKRIYYY